MAQTVAPASTVLDSMRQNQLQLQVGMVCGLVSVGDMSIHSAVMAAHLESLQQHIIKNKLNTHGISGDILLLPPLTTQICISGQISPPIQGCSNLVIQGDPKHSAQLVTPGHQYLLEYGLSAISVFTSPTMV